MKDLWTKISAFKDSAADSAVGKAAGEAVSETLDAAKALSLNAADEIKQLKERVAPVVLEKAGQASQRAKVLSADAAVEMKVVADRVVKAVRKIDENHEKVTERLETVAKVTGLASAAAAVAAVLAAPHGFAAIGVELGLTRAPLMVRAAPVLWGIATAAGLVSGCMYFYSRWRRRQDKRGSSQPR